MKQPSIQHIGQLTMMEKPQGYEAHYGYSEHMYTAEYHCHDFYEFYIHIRGGQYFGLDDELYLLKPNQIFIIPPFSMHGLSNVNELHGYERAWVNVSMETLKNLGCKQIDLDQCFRACTDQHRYSFQLTEAEAASCINLIRSLQQSTPARDALESLTNFSALMSLMIIICRTIGQTEDLTQRVVSNSVIRNVLTYINNNYTQPLHIAELARRFGISVSYLPHEFMKFTNRSVYDYILYRRVMLARQMMQTDDTLNTIAYQCGFNDYSNFLRIFNKLVGMSPSAYRRQLMHFTQ